ncbi:hypothetical protein C8J57DRAFT_1500908 [Mycena rebaudengoi]|nr:hypothetical protein C8J57DRAFT_1500908 [Mycena rebaudengoi]
MDQVQTLPINIFNSRRGEMISSAAKTLRHLVPKLECLSPPLLEPSLIHRPSVASDFIGWLSYMPQLLILTPQTPSVQSHLPPHFGHTLAAIKDLYPQFHAALHTISVVFDIQEQATKDKFLATLSSSFDGIDVCLSAYEALSGCAPSHLSQSPPWGRYSHTLLQQ